jgi:hypothetical protein
MSPVTSSGHQACKKSEEETDETKTTRIARLLDVRLGIADELEAGDAGGPV